jgi:hypothetical protein
MKSIARKDHDHGDDDEDVGDDDNDEHKYYHLLNVRTL